MLHPLPVGADDYRHRVGGVIAAMGADLLGRVLIDSEDVRLSALACACSAPHVELHFWGSMGFVRLCTGQLGQGIGRLLSSLCSAAADPGVRI